MSERLQILRHSLGLDHNGRGTVYRNHFVTGEGSVDYPVCMELVAANLMQRREGSALTGGDYLFTVTEAGRAYVDMCRPEPEKLTRGQRRYRSWLNSECGVSFGDWIKRGVRA